MYEDRSNDPNPKTSRETVYQIRLEGHLSQGWTAWLEGSSLTLEGGDTLLTCRVADQAALYGLLKKVRDSGLPLISVNHLGGDEARRSGSETVKLASPRITEGVT